MPTQDTSQIKEKIISILRRNGPSLPVHIAREIESSILFTSAFLSELLSEKKIKISNMKVGSSPLYFIQGQEPRLEKFAEHLKSREKDAFNLLKERKFLADSSQEPAIRVALRQIRDFAIPFKKPETDEIFWRFFTVPETEFSEKIKIQPKPEKEDRREKEEVKEKPLDIFSGTKAEIAEKPKEIELEKTKPKKTKTKKSKKTKKKVSKKQDKFFNKVKYFLSENSLELIDIENFSKKEITLRIRDYEDQSREKILVAFDKKRINESDILKAAKKASEFNLPYVILGRGEPLKKVQELIQATKNLSSIKKFK